MRILITGGLGYLGGRITHYLKGNNYDNLIVGTRRHIEKSGSLSGLNFVNTNWSSSIDLEKICQDVDIIIHTSGMNSSDCFLSPSLANEVNGFSTSRLLKAAIKNKVKRFVYFSTAHVYSSSLTGRISEKSLCTNPHPYATSHKIGEDAVRFHHKNKDIEGIVIRLSNSFGAPIDVDVNCWSLVTNDLCRQAFESNQMTLNSNGSQKRDFISINNVCRAIEHLIFIPSKRIKDGLFNIGGEWTPSIIDIAEILRERIYKLTEKEINIKMRKSNENSKLEPLNYDINKIKLTGFELVNDRNHEIDNLIKFCSENFSS